MSLGQGLASKYYSGFNPLIYGNCALWVDAGDTTSLTLSGSNITAVRDKSPQSNAITVSATQPTYVSNRQNGLGGIFMNGASWLINTTLSYSLANRTIFIVAEQTASSTTSFEGILVFGGSATTLDFNSSNAIVYSARGSNAGQNVSFSVYGRGGDYVLNFGTSTTPMPFRVYSESFAYPNGTLFVDGSQTVTDTAALTVGTATGWVIGGRFDANNSTPRVPLYGYIYEILVYSNTLPAIDRQAIESYLMRKWGRTANLPTTHPYASIVPVTRSFLPLDISGCSLWLDAADFQSFTLTGTDVSQWRDKSGSNNHMNQYSAATAPSLSTLNGYNTVFFNTADPTSAQYTEPFTNIKVLRGTNFQTTSNSTVFLVATPMYTATNTRFIVNLKSRNATSWANLYDWTLGTGNGIYSSYVRTDTTLVGADNSYYASNTTSLTAVQVTGTSVAFYRNGSVYSSGTLSLPMPASDAFQVFTIGGYLNTDPYDFVCKQGARIHFNELLVYNGSLTTYEREQVEGYLARKWGFQGSTSSLTTFIPTQISGCALWLDAADSSTITLSGSSVTQWNDKSGNARNASGGVSPTFSNNAVVFNGSTQHLTTTYTAVPSAETVFVVATITGSTAPQNYFIFGTATTNGRGYQVNLTSGTYTVNWDKSGVARYAATGGILQNVRFLTSGLFTGTAGSTGVNGGSQSTQASFSFSGAGTTAIGGAGNTAGTFWQGSINEIIIYNTTLTTDQRQQIEGYLARKWGLAGNLPSSHPYVLQSLPSTHPFISRLPATLSFNPRQIPNCALWLDAADRYTLTLSGSNVTAWADKSPNQFVGTVFNSPVYTQNALGQCPGVAFNGSSQYINFGNVLNLGTSSIYVFSVCKYDTTGDGTIIAKSSYRGNPARWWLTRAAVDGGQTMGISPALDTVGLASFSDTTTNVQLFSGYWDRSAVFVLQNGTQRATTSLVSSSNLSNTDPLYVAAYPNSNGTAPNTIGGYTYLNGKIGEIIVYNGSLTLSQRQQVEGYLAWKWGLQGSLSLLTTFSVPGISGCTLWLDAADSSTFTFSSGSNISQWRDKSSSALTGTAVNSPTLIQSGINGFPSVSFNGSSQYINFGNVLNMGTNHIYVFVVCQFSSTASGGVVGKTSARGNPARWALLRESGNMIMIIEGASVAINNCTYADSSTRARVLTGYWDRSNVFNLENGIQRAVVALADTTSLSNTDPLYIGAYPNSTGTGPLAGLYFGGTIAEIIVYQAALTTTQRQQVETYLASKWGVSGLGLPSTHPYKKISPI